MAYVYDDVAKLANTALVGSQQCVALVQHYAKAPLTSKWTAGAAVLGNKDIKTGTAVATFVDGKYPNLAHGNHAALYASQDATGISLMDQWKGDPNKPKVSQRYLRGKGKNKDGKYLDPSNNADAFFVIE